MRIIIAAIVSFLINASTVHGCECGDTTPASCLKNATVIFEGRVESMRIRTHRLFEGMTLTKSRITEYPVFTLKVGKIYKGSLPDHVRVATGIGTADGTAAPDCSFPFELSKEYLVYAWDDSTEYSDLLSTNICSGTNPIYDAGLYLRNLQNSPPTLEDKLREQEDKLREEGDFKRLAKLYESRATAQISGKVSGLAKSGRRYLDFRIWRSVEGEWRRQLSFEEIGQDGGYAYRHLEPGEYKIGVLQDLGKGSRRIGFYGGAERFEEGRSIRVGPEENVTGINIQLKPQSRHTVQGRVICAGGNPFKGQIKIRVANDWDRNQKIGAKINSCGAFRIHGAYSGKFRVIATLEPDNLGPLGAWTISVPEITVPEEAGDVVLRLERESLTERAISHARSIWDIWDVLAEAEPMRQSSTILGVVGL